MDISCEKCLCSKCDNWETCNDSIYNVDNWCDVCNDLDIEHCFTDKCKGFKSISYYLSHTLQIARR